MTSVSLLDPWLVDRDNTSGVAQGERVNWGRFENVGPAASSAQLETTEVTLSQMSPLDVGATLSVNS